MSTREQLYSISPSNDSTVALELSKTGLMRRNKHILFFENFRGELSYGPDPIPASRVNLIIDAASVVCRDKWLRANRQQAVTRYARAEALLADRHPQIEFLSSRISNKALRGLVVEGVLNIRGITRTLKINVVLTPMKHDRLQIDGDAVFRLSDFDIQPPSKFFGLIGTRDEALLRLLLWATRL
jgi:polyisoprenoid-binding protein YceI